MTLLTSSIWSTRGKTRAVRSPERSGQRGTTPMRLRKDHTRSSSHDWSLVLAKGLPIRPQIQRDSFSAIELATSSGLGDSRMSLGNVTLALLAIGFTISEFIQSKTARSDEWAAKSIGCWYVGQHESFLAGGDQQTLIERDQLE